MKTTTQVKTLPSCKLGVESPNNMDSKKDIKTEHVSQSFGHV